MRSFFSNTVTSWPARASCCAAASPAGPLPITATRLPLGAAGGAGTTEPLSQARAVIGFLDLLDGDGGLADAQHAGGFTGRGTDASGEFREIVGGVQLAHRLLPAPLVDQIVPIGNDVGERAAGVAEGDAAIHAARGLVAQVVLGERQVDFEPVLDAHGGVAALGQLPRVFHEAGDFSHDVSLLIK